MAIFDALGGSDCLGNDADVFSYMAVLATASGFIWKQFSRAASRPKRANQRRSVYCAAAHWARRPAWAPADRYRWWADITAASSAYNVTIYLDLQQFRGGIGPITWCERQRLVLGTRDVIAKGETFQVPLVDEFEREDGNKFIGWCLRGYEYDPKARLALGTTSTRCRLFLESEAGKKGRFLFYVLDRPAADAPPMLFGEHLLDFEKEWRDLIES
jgi:hypothetical protein